MKIYRPIDAAHVKPTFPLTNDAIQKDPLTSPSPLVTRRASDGDSASSIPRRLLTSFAAALSSPGNEPLPPQQTAHDIQTTELLHACHLLKDCLRTLGGQDRNTAENVARNIRKFQALYEMAPAGRRETLRLLLAYEKELGIHGGGSMDGNIKPRDRSGAMGLLWIRRSLALQERMFSLMLENPTWSSKEAALVAYRETLEPFHNWALQRICLVTLKKTTPPRHKLLQKLSGVAAKENFGVVQERETIHDLQTLCETWKPVRLCCDREMQQMHGLLGAFLSKLYTLSLQLLKTWEEIFNDLGLEDTRKA